MIAALLGALIGVVLVFGLVAIGYMIGDALAGLHEWWVSR